jgi:ribonuclease HII
MTRLHDDYPAYDFVTHKGYITPTHTAALDEHGPCEIHRRRFVNVRRAMGEAVPGYADEFGEDGGEAEVGVELQETGPDTGHETGHVTVEVGR